MTLTESTMHHLCVPHLVAAHKRRGLPSSSQRGLFESMAGGWMQVHI